MVSTLVVRTIPDGYHMRQYHCDTNTSQVGTNALRVPGLAG
jgi:hypothetical protein